jgi:hypothetical protein
MFKNNVFLIVVFVIAFLTFFSRSSGLLASAEESEPHYHENLIVETFNINNSDEYIDDNSLKGKIEETDYEFVTFYFIPEKPFSKLEDLSTNSSIKISELEEIKIVKLDQLTPTERRLKNIAGFVAVGGMAVSTSINRSMGEKKALGRIADNFTRPIASLKDGYRADDGQFLVNYVGHPLEFYLLSSYLKADGASDLETFLLCQAANLSWEYLVEGTYVNPSPKDLLTDTAGTIAGIILYKTVLRKPIDYAYNKISGIRDTYGIELTPQINYNANTKGALVGIKLKFATK